MIKTRTSAKLIAAHRKTFKNFFFRGKDKNDEDEEGKIQPERFYGPPTSCNDLQKLGYTLNGYYLIKQTDESNHSAIQVVYCTFRQQQAVIKSKYKTIQKLNFSIEIL